MAGPDDAPPIETDALIVGAGPAGLFAVFELGLLGLHAEVVDALPYLGGQCVELYAGKPIYDIPGLPRTTGADLVQRLADQAAPFKAGMHLGQLVASLRREADGRFALATDSGTRFLARVVVIAAGAGAFLPRSLKLPGIEPLVGQQVRYRPLAADDIVGCTGRHVVVVGDEDAALRQACALAEAGNAARVTLVHRRDEFRATVELVGRQRALRAEGRLHFSAGQPVGLHVDSGRLTAIDLADADDTTRRLDVDLLLPLLGLSPKLGPVADWGLALERKHLAVDPARFQTSEPGIFAIGDVAAYPGKLKLLLCGFHEATLAAFAAAAHIRPGQRQTLEYTTTSPRLHALLGVTPEA